MKKMFPLLLLLAGCVGASMPSFTEKNAGETVTVKKGELFEVALVSNPSTGFRWEMLPSPCKIEKSEFRLPVEARGLCGAAGTEHFFIRPDRVGKNVLKFVYRRSWEKEPPVQTFSLEVRVTE